MSNKLKEKLYFFRDKIETIKKTCPIICIEGNDCVGKSSLIRRLCEYFIEVYSAQVTNNILGDKIRDILTSYNLGDLQIPFANKLFDLSYILTMRTIIYHYHPSLKAIFLDRWVYSNYAYTGHLTEYGEELLNIPSHIIHIPCNKETYEDNVYLGDIDLYDDVSYQEYMGREDRYNALYYLEKNKLPTVCIASPRDDSHNMTIVQNIMNEYKKND